MKKNLSYLVVARLLSRLLFLFGLFGLVFLVVVIGDQGNIPVSIDVAFAVVLGLFVGSFLTGFIPGYVLTARFYTLSDNGDSTLKNTGYDDRSNAKEDSIIPKEILGRSWGALIFGQLWFSYHRLPQFLKRSQRPRYFYLPLYFFLHGRELAWQYNPYSSVDDFLTEQASWDRWSFVFSIVGLLSTAGFISMVFYLSAI